MKKTLIAFTLLVSALSHGASPLGNISRTNTVYTAPEIDASFATRTEMESAIDTSVNQIVGIVGPNAQISTNSYTLGLANIGNVMRVTNSCAFNLASNSVVDWASAKTVGSTTISPTLYFRVETTNAPTFTSGVTTNTGINDPRGIISGSTNVGSSFALVWVTTNLWDVY